MSLFLNPGNPPDLAEMRSPLSGKEGPCFRDLESMPLGIMGPTTLGTFRWEARGGCHTWNLPNYYRNEWSTSVKTRENYFYDNEAERFGNAGKMQVTKKNF